MKITKHLPAILVITVLVLGVGVIVSQFFPSSTKGVLVNVRVPDLSETASSGKTAFDANCAQCHGPNAAGSDRGPPLVHDIYNPGHHGDMSFVFAAKRGVRGHHWRFGNMPAQPQVTDHEMASIIRYVRELQAANGIFYKPHKM